MGEGVGEREREEVDVSVCSGGGDCGSSDDPRLGIRSIWC